MDLPSHEATGPAKGDEDGEDEDAEEGEEEEEEEEEEEPAPTNCCKRSRKWCRECRLPMGARKFNYALLFLWYPL